MPISSNPAKIGYARTPVSNFVNMYQVELPLMDTSHAKRELQRFCSLEQPVQRPADRPAKKDHNRM
jgi:hypothetical protein